MPPSKHQFSTGRYAEFADQHLQVSKRTGPNWTVMCEFHEDNNPSMSFHTEKGLWHCWSCGAKGNISRLAMQLGMEVRPNGFVVDLDDPEADAAALIRMLTDVDQPPATIVKLPEAWLDRFDTDYEGSYWQERGFTAEAMEAWGLGYDALLNQATIGLRDDNGDVLGVIRRKLDGSHPRYLNPKGFDKRKALFGSWDLGQSETVVLTEGPLDAISVWEASHPSGAVMGSGLQVDQVRLLHRHGVEHVVLFFDNDAAGFKMAMEAVYLLHDDFAISAVEYPINSPDDPGGMDADMIDHLVDTALALNF